MQVQVQEIEDKKVFKPVSVVLNFEYKEDFDMFFNIVSYDRSIPKLIAVDSTNSKEQYDHCQHILSCIHQSMREYKCLKS